MNDALDEPDGDQLKGGVCGEYFFLLCYLIFWGIESLNF